MWILTRWGYDRMRALLAGSVRRQWRRVLEEFLMLRGAVAGFGHGIGLRQVKRQDFVTVRDIESARR